jgi:hypothetical protein
MSAWNPPPATGIKERLNQEFGNIDAKGWFRFPNLHDDSNFILASDYSGEHEKPEFQVLAFLLTQSCSVFKDWEAARVAVRTKYLSDGRRMAFKTLNEPRRIRALREFMVAASLLNGVLVCIGVEKKVSLSSRCKFPPLQHTWSPDVLEKLLRISVFGSSLVDGLKVEDRDLYWLTDDDAIVATENAKNDAALLMSSMLHASPVGNPTLHLGIGSGFDDGTRAEDLLSIPDLAAGAYSEMLSKMGKPNMPEHQVGRQRLDFAMQVKTMLITAWRSDDTQPLKHFDLLVRDAGNGQLRLSPGHASFRLPSPGEPTAPQPEIHPKWAKAMADWLTEINDMPPG